MKNKGSLAIFSISHLIVDFACFYVLMGSFYKGVNNLTLISTGFLIYNAIAFALQVPIGYWADKVRFSHTYFALGGCFLVALGVVSPVSPWIRLGLCSFGNAFFHVGGGIDSLVFAGGKFTRSGIFISSGAIGVALGSMSGRDALISAWLVAVFLIVCIVLMLFFGMQRKIPYEAVFCFKPSTIKRGDLVIYICMFSIVIRAAVGAFTPILWKSTDFLTLLPAFCVFIGKLMGGVLADRFGTRNIAAGSLIVSAPLLALFNGNILLCCIGLILFNVTTAITLCVIVSHLPNNPGLGFGLTTLALFIGTAISFFWAMPEQIRVLIIFILIIASSLCIILTTSNTKKNKINQEES